MRSIRKKKKVLKRVNFVVIIVIILCTIQITSNKYHRSLKTEKTKVVKANKNNGNKGNSEQKVEKKSNNKNDNDSKDYSKKSNKKIDKKESNNKNLNQRLLLVNRDNRLDENYFPRDLTVPNVRFLGNRNFQIKRLRREASEALENLFQEAKKENIILLGVSGYRNYNYQVNVYNNSVYRNGKEHADNYVAQPGASEHQTGLAMDIVSTEYINLDENFVNTKAYKWLKQNCYKHGFIIRYPKEKEYVTGYKFEPWHIRYVGVEAATEIMNRGITLEEYIQENKAK
ncbi:M15 family metallopeptidase [Clostridium tepidum]|jgi:D-alanyl-D-alanine carboxypeptidase|uniref:M15 family metallopeptidase n=1 Tax=Clostridium tepidum TaxID=1962263 RepID=UPI0018ABEEC6|nr:M15 family metallopeptidase [Clostridium tepidum]MCR1934721.1 M15 family metallopeptidase [Clostridium tepidum]